MKHEIRAMDDNPLTRPRTGDRTVYIRPADLAELPQAARDWAAESDRFYVLHDADGERLAIVLGRRFAFEIARDHDFIPVHVH